MPIDVYEAARFEPLWGRFQKALETPPASPLAREIIVVPASGWESWFSRRLATTRGCWAQYLFLTTGQWIFRTLGQVLGTGNTHWHDADSLMWAAAAKLPPLLDEQGFERVKQYLSPGGSLDDQRLVELARSLGGLFDQYLLCRPELLEAWEKGLDWPEGASAPVPAHAPWQRMLWTAMRETVDARPVAALVKELAEAIESGHVQLPERASVWLCGGLPPAHFDFLDVIGRHRQIDLYALTPSRARPEVGDSHMPSRPSPRDAEASASAPGRVRPSDPPHPLLISMGTLSRERGASMRERPREPLRVHAFDTDAPSGVKEPTLLEKLQWRIRNGRPSAPELAGADKSLRIHNCHSAIREVEVLREQLREAFGEDQDLQPEDVVVLCPDLDIYAPLFDAVFGLTIPGQPGHVPYNIAGRSRQTRPIVDAYFRLLDVLQGRFPVSEVLDLVNLAPIGSTAGLGPKDVEQISDWIAASGVRWGGDREHRVAERLPATDLNTWAFGFDRLLLGYAMPPGGEQRVEGILALDRAEGRDAEKLGTFWAFVEKLRAHRAIANQRRAIKEWRAPFCGLVETFLETEHDEAGAQWIQDAIDRLVSLAAEGGHDGMVPFRIAARELARQVDRQSGGRPFRLGGVTVCELSAMRGLPFKVVALLGLNDGAFPRTGQPVGFDLINLHPRPGDRRPRLEDKELFLEALLAARSRLIVTCQGQNVRDQRSRPPSVVVEELLDAAQEDFSDDGSAELREALVVPHPLQPFSTRYFDGRDERLFSHEERDLGTAGKLAGERAEPATFVSDALVCEHDEARIRVADFSKLVTAPWQLFLRGLGVSMDDFAESLDDREPLCLNPLERWKIGDPWVRRTLEGWEEEELERRFARSGQLPAGALGQSVLGVLRRDAGMVVCDARANGIGKPGSDLAVRLELDGALLAGSVPDFTGNGIQRTTFSRISDGKALPLWLDHLLATASEGRELESALLVGRGGKPRRIQGIGPEEAKAELAKLVPLYRLSKCVPFPFFGKAVEKMIALLRANKLDLLDPDSRAEALNEARKAYENDFIGTADARKPSVRAAFRGRDPFEIPCRVLPGLEGEDPELSLFFHLVKAICEPFVNGLQAG